MPELSDDETLFRENVLMQIEVSAAAMITLRGQIRKIGEVLGIDTEAVSITPIESENQAKLLTSVRDRVVNIATINAKKRGLSLNRDQVIANVEKIFGEAIASHGESLRDDVAVETAVYDGAEDTKVTGRTPHTSPNMAAVPKTSIPAGQDEGALDEDILAIFKTTRENKIAKPYVEIGDGLFRANFYDPEVPPETPQEFAAREDDLHTYFRNMVKDAKREGHIDAGTAAAVFDVMDSPHEIIHDDSLLMTPDRYIMTKIIAQGQDQPYFEVSANTPIEFSEALITAYSVSVARLRGMYVDVKLNELDTYMKEST